MRDPHLWPEITEATLRAGLAATRDADNKDALTRGLAPTCRDCKTAIHDGDTCVECWRDRRALAVERDREWWRA